MEILHDDVLAFFNEMIQKERELNIATKSFKTEHQYLERDLTLIRAEKLLMVLQNYKSWQMEKKLLKPKRKK